MYCYIDIDIERVCVCECVRALAENIENKALLVTKKKVLKVKSLGVGWL